MNDLSLVPLPVEDIAQDEGLSAIAIPVQRSMGLGEGAHEGAERISREMIRWNPLIRSPDAEINNEKPILDARGRDLVRNTGMMQGAVSTHRDSIVGSQFRLNSNPNWRYLGLDKTWADEFQLEVESLFTLYAESNDCWIDASRMNTLTGLVRMSIGMFFFGGEVLGTMEWMKGVQRPFRTALQMVDPDRLNNPQGRNDSQFLRRGVEKDVYGAPIAYNIQKAHPADYMLSPEVYQWDRVPIRKPWGRLMVMHIIEQLRPDQTRGVAEMVAVLKEMRMTKKFHEVVLQNAVVNATYAAAIESELPPEVALDTIGVGDSDGGMLNQSDAMLKAIAEYQLGAKNINIDGVKIPHLYPNTKLKMYPAGSIGGVGENFEQSLLRYVASALGLSYEQFSRDYTNTNYSSARASMNETYKYMQSRKKSVADKVANCIFACWLEEAINGKKISSMPKKKAPSFYDALNKDALCRATWVGAARGQVDELKETQAAVLRIAAGLSTLEAECAGMGKDYREVIEQQQREMGLMKAAGLDFDRTITKPGTGAGGDTTNNNTNDGNQNNNSGANNG